jgi:hypothetical protein
MGFHRRFLVPRTCNNVWNGDGALSQPGLADTARVRQARTNPQSPAKLYQKGVLNQHFDTSQNSHFEVISVTNRH